ncbi:DNA topoisomerase 3-alpha, putative [Entamoeba invadens IP1]|uniref:DNA topoisomerase 3-alpha, putative n=1 Tax=Entamoeba invadens IP1 TaxID=370355 RepID=UPI0002C3EE62|nr:DNA topoisomerase 3-alpha, putative [Entamoeba invadens IP1]ELP93021.1 DNA topoisomerase 3-alpha, putative [Entamoeba invadens IP1]|eukprot:XP_004259792.1 DNA topoisomerase 3-alpha, putative [Entamoeba invadens IP1]
MVKYVLHIAEKPSVAQSVAYTLSKGKSKKCQGKSKFNPIHKFDAEFRDKGMKNQVVTSVSGHLMELEFTPEFRNWGMCNPVDLFTAPVAKYVPSRSKETEANLKDVAKGADTLVLWLDCDREGENISFEVIDVCESVNKHLKVFRAHFNSLVPVEIARAYRTLTPPDKNLSDAVDIRQELDLRTGAAFTRFQTTLLKRQVPVLKDLKVISYGACQFPTLGFVIDRYYQIKSFTKEKFYKIKCIVKKEGIETEFLWDRNRLFDRIACLILYEDALDKVKQAKITEILQKSKTNFKPLPLTTVDLQKSCSKFFKISSNQTMTIAEKLYQSGLISYPRTETNIYPADMNHTKQLEMFANSNTYGEYVKQLLDGKMKPPRNGKATDKSHPPIHPTKLIETGLVGNEKTIYDFVVRSYLANLSDDARGFETKIGLQIGEESFHANGLVITERNYLDIYKYRKWTEKQIPNFEEGETVDVTSLTQEMGETSPPKPLTEPELIQLMDKNGIGTDATIAQHIAKIIEREYVVVIKGGFSPTNLGLALVEGYDSMGFEFSRPLLRAETERQLKKISEGEANKDDVVSLFIDQYETLFTRAESKKKCLVDAARKLLAQTAD